MNNFYNNFLINKHEVSFIFNIFEKENLEIRLVGGCVRDLLLERKSKDIDCVVNTSPDFIIESQKDLIGAAGEIANILSLLLGGIAGISLAVGGIGVMNIMLVSVTERTREIGIRRAVGATKGDIIKQFVWEALTLSSMGGIIGIILGMIISFSLDGRFTFDDFTVRTVIQPWSILIAFAVSFGIGLVSGVYPAFRASRLDPILALRNE